MAFADMPEYLIRIILHVHMQSVCEIVHGSYISTVQMKRGFDKAALQRLLYTWTVLLCQRCTNYDAFC